MNMHDAHPAPPADPLGFLELTRDLLRGYPPSEVYVLRVKGDGLLDASLKDGDLAVMHRARHPEHEKLMDVAVKGERHLRHVYIETRGLAGKETGRLRLVARADDTPEIWAEAGTWEIRGRVILMIRYLEGETE